MAGPGAPSGRGNIKRIILLVVLVSLGIHLAAGVVAGIVIIARYFAEPPAEFKAAKDVRIPAQEREHRMNMAEFDGGASKPAFLDKMASSRPSSFSLPDLPQIPVDTATDIDPTGMVSDQLASIAGSEGIGSGGGMAAGGSGGSGRGSSVNFFGIDDMASRIVIVVDVSDTMFDRQPGKFDAVKKEASRLVGGLGMNTLFNIIVYEGGSVAMFPEVQPATDANKEKAAAWLQKITGGSAEQRASYRGMYSKMGTGLYEGGGTRTDTALKQALGLKPSTVFLITDGEMNRRGAAASEDEDGGGGTIEEDELLKIVRAEQAKLEPPARIHVVHFLTKAAREEEEKTLKALTRRNDGRFRQVKAEDY